MMISFSTLLNTFTAQSSVSIPSTGNIIIFFLLGLSVPVCYFPFSYILVMHTLFKCVVSVAMVTSLLLTHISCLTSTDIRVPFSNPSQSSCFWALTLIQSVRCWKSLTYYMSAFRKLWFIKNHDFFFRLYYTAGSWLRYFSLHRKLVEIPLLTCHACRLFNQCRITTWLFSLTWHSQRGVALRLVARQPICVNNDLTSGWEWISPLLRTMMQLFSRIRTQSGSGSVFGLVKYPLV